MYISRHLYKVTFSSKISLDILVYLMCTPVCNIRFYFFICYQSLQKYVVYKIFLFHLTTQNKFFENENDRFNSMKMLRTKLNIFGLTSIDFLKDRNDYFSQ